MRLPISEDPPACTTADAVIALRIAVGSHPPDLCYDVSGDGHVADIVYVSGDGRDSEIRDSRNEIEVVLDIR